MFGQQHQQNKPIFGSRRMGSSDYEEVAPGESSPGVPEIVKDLFTITKGISGIEKSVENLDKKFEDLSEVRPFIESRVSSSIYDLKDEIKDIFKCLQGSITDRLSSIEAQIKDSVIEKKEKEANNNLDRAKQEIEQVKKDTQEKFSKLENLIAGMFETNKNQVQDKVDAGFNQQEVKFRSIETQVGELKKVIESAVMNDEMKRNNNQVPRPDCARCHVVFDATSKLGQCSSGHLVCWECEVRPSASTQPPRSSRPSENTRCPTCFQPITGRADYSSIYRDFRHLKIFQLFSHFYV